MIPKPSQPKPCAGCPEAHVPPSVPARAANTPSAAPSTAARKSCMECVEKHIGAAWALLSEYHHGYPYKVLIIGHLHEAEEESAEWSELHAMIRETRKQFQQGDRTPDFAAISLKIKETRDRIALFQNRSW